MAKNDGFMAEAMRQAHLAGEQGEIPVGAVLVLDGEIIAASGNRTRIDNDATAHAEMMVLRQACERLGQERLLDADLYVTLEPCTMCAAAISFSRIRRLYYGAEDPKGGGVDNGVRFYDKPTCHHAPEVYSGLGETESAALLKAFFKSRRSK